MKQVGNDGELRDRNIGPTGVERGRNRIRTQGRPHVSPPLLRPVREAGLRTKGLAPGLGGRR